LHKKLPKKFESQATKLFYESFGRRHTAEDDDKYCSKPFLNLLAIEKDSVIGAARLFRRKIAYRGRKIRLGGIGEVCTREDKRRRGVATALTIRGMEVLKSENSDVAYLCTDITDSLRTKLYSKFGFVVLKKPYTYLGKSGKRYTETNGMIAPVKSREKFWLILKGKETLDLGKGNW
jgi:predicted GNAT family N-acyltransferase